MNKIALLTLSFPAMILGGSSSFAQDIDLADHRVFQLEQTAPEKLVSEAPYATEWVSIPEKNIHWKCRMWRTIDMRDPTNKQLTDIGPPRRDLATVLLAGAANGEIKVYGAGDDRFTHSLSVDSIRSLIAAGGRNSAINTFRVKQDWLYYGGGGSLIEETRVLAGRIIGIAPLRQTVAANGVTIEEPLFWIYYPSIRNFLRKMSLPHSKDAEVNNLDELFEKMKFSSTINEVRNSTSYLMKEGKLIPAGEKISGH